MIYHNPILPKFRLYGENAQFETEAHLELFFWNTVLNEMGLQPLKRQHYCREGICDILAKGTKNQLVIIELKNVKDSHVIDQITSYFDALSQERPFSEQIDYTQPIDLYIISPEYNSRTHSTLKHHKLKFNLFSYTAQVSGQDILFTLREWDSQIEKLSVKISPLSSNITIEDIPSPPKNFQTIIGQSSTHEIQSADLIREKIYQFARSNNFKLTEKPTGKSLRFERNKQNPIAEIDWDKKRNILVIYLWLPFVTINGRSNQGAFQDRYKRTAMMRLWVENELVQYVGYIDKGRKSWIVITPDEFKDETIPTPTKLKNNYSYEHYWKGLAMPTEDYFKICQIVDRPHTLQSFIDLALEHSVSRAQRSKRSKTELLGLEME